jgi:hypothetical protein
MTRPMILSVGVLLALSLATDAFAWGAVSGPRGGAVYRGPMGGAAVRGPYGGAAVRGPYGGAAVRGPYGGVAARGCGRAGRDGDHFERVVCAHAVGGQPASACCNILRAPGVGIKGMTLDGLGRD